MSDVIGPVAFNTRTRAPFLRLPDGENLEHIAEETAREIDREVRRLMTEAYELATVTLRERRSALDKVVRLLLEREMVEGNEVRQIVRECDHSMVP
jgi:cell division protease FtsH